MKARELVDQLQKYDPDEEVIALVWFKDTFDFDSNEDLTLTDEAWLKVVKEMEESGGIDAGEQQISEHISDAVVEHSVLDIK
jgi:hypothetical protein